MEKQLDLFEGVILTQEQEQMIKEFIASKEKSAEEAFNYNRRLWSVLVEAGFKEGVDFKNTFETKVITSDEVTLGSYYRDNQFVAKDVTYVTTTGHITLLSKMYNKEENKVVDRGISYLTLERDNKIECSTLVGSYRKVKATTLLEKLREQRMNAETEKTHINQVNRAFMDAISDLREKFPMAEVYSFDDYDKYGRNYRTVQRVKAKFENGSYVTFNVGLDGNYRMNYKYDAAISKMDMMQTLEFFANQNK